MARAGRIPLVLFVLMVSLGRPGAVVDAADFDVERGERMLDRLDRDGDGRVSMEEVQDTPALRRNYHRADLDGDNELDAREIARVIASGGDTGAGDQ